MPNQTDAPAAAVSLVEMMSRLVRVAGMPFGVVSVAVYLAQLVVTAGMVAVAHTLPPVLSSDAVRGPVKLAPALAKKDR